MNTHDKINRLIDKLEAIPAMDFAARAKGFLDLRAAIEADRKRRFQNGEALQRFKKCGADEEQDPIERLRFFCSLAMSGQDWLDSEQFFDDLIADRQRRGEPVGYIMPTALKQLRAGGNAIVGGVSQGCDVPIYTAPQPAEPSKGETVLYTSQEALDLTSRSDAVISVGLTRVPQMSWNVPLYTAPQPAEPVRGEPVAKIDPNPPQLSIVWHDSPESVDRAMWEQSAIEAGLTYEELIEGSNVGETEDGEVFEFTHEQAIDGMHTQGCWGFVDTKTNTINAWAADDVDASTVLHMLAHEIGHVTGDPHDDDMQEEMRAEQFGRVAALAYRLWCEKKSDAPQAAEPSRGEPVAWTTPDGREPISAPLKESRLDLYSKHYTVPLYTAPQPAEPVKRKRPYAQGTALGEFGIIPMCDQVNDEPVEGARAATDHSLPELSIVWHDSPEGVDRAMWEEAAQDAGLSYEDLRDSVTVGQDENGAPVELTHAQTIDAIRNQGCWGFVDTNTGTIHAWAADDADPMLVVHMLAHEIGHMTGEQHPDELQEEMRAEQFGRVAAMAFRMWRQSKGLQLGDHPDSTRWRKARTLPRLWWLQAWAKVQHGASIDDLVDAEIRRRLP